MLIKSFISVARGEEKRSHFSEEVSASARYHVVQIDRRQFPSLILGLDHDKILVSIDIGKTVHPNMF